VTNFLPLTKAEMAHRGWKNLDFVLITGDAYVDHPYFGTAIISRYLEHLGFSVGIIPQPDWKDVEAFRALGRPRLAFLITSGNIDSMVNHYTASKKKRKTDVYAPNGISGRRPDRAVLVYSGMAKQAYKGVPVILGGIEASLRRLSHYDYWSDKLRKSVLLDSKADLLVYGMGERAIGEIAESMNAGVPIEEISSVRGTVWKTKSLESHNRYELLPAFQEVLEFKKRFAESTAARLSGSDPISSVSLVEPYEGWFLVQNPPSLPLSATEMDTIYDLPYTRKIHPSYTVVGGVPAIEEVKFSIVSSRGCFGGCSFCSLQFHQGKHISARSHDSILREARSFLSDEDFKGYIHDVGGPTANFRQGPCKKQQDKGFCTDRDCLSPQTCSNLKADHGDYLSLLQKLRKIDGIKKVFIRSGIRYDYLQADDDGSFFKELVEHHVSGQLKIAPEHVSEKVLNLMGKPGIDGYEKFVRQFKKVNTGLGKKQYLIPYFISAHPGSGLAEAIELAIFLKKYHFIPDQVQDFYPTPGTIATCMYYTGLDPRSLESVYVARGERERRLQRALFHFHKKENHHLVREALLSAGRGDLIGKTKHCLVP
jgi:uncharacterized radical SAM protein YgiQ